VAQIGRAVYVPLPAAHTYFLPVLIDALDAQVPLSLLEAVRSLDRPVEALEAEYVSELSNKRLGMSDTVYAQVRRYSDAARRGQRITREETAALARLLSRRPDAERVFRTAGQYLARQSFATLTALTQRVLLTFPGIITRPMGLSRLRRLAHRYLAGNVTRVGAFVFLEVPDPVMAENEHGDVGAVYYEAALREYAALLVGSSGAVERTRTERKGGAYEWRAEWRAAPPAERRQLRQVRAKAQRN
jgi:hypothetical protein